MTVPTTTRTTRPTVAVMAKAPRAGHSKTRLCPPCRPDQAAALAEAALRDTFVVVRDTPGVRRVVALDGPVGPWWPDGFALVRQRGDSLDQRLAAAIEDVGGPLVVIGMDTPQLTVAALADLVARVRFGSAVIGPATDGGWWALGLHEADGALLRGVPMSVDCTYRCQVERLRQAGLTVDVAGHLTDVDHWPDAVAAAELTPGSHFARAVRGVQRDLAAVSA